MNLDQEIRDALRSSVRPADTAAGYRAVQARLHPAPRRRPSGPRVAVYASIAVVLVAAITVVSLEAVKHLGNDRPVVVITDDTAGMSPGSTSSLPGAGTSATTVTVVRPQLLWKVPTGGHIYAPPVVSGGLVYVASSDGYLRALDTRTGTERWKFNEGDYGLHSGPAIADRVVYYGSEDRNLYALEALTGRQRWTFGTGGMLQSPPVVSEGVAYVGSRDFYLYAIDTQTGQQIWRFWTGGPIDASPAVSGDVVCVTSVTSEDVQLYAVDTRTGEQRWSFRTGNGGYSPSPAIADGVVFVRGEDHLYALSLQTGAEKWHYSVPTPTDFSSPGISLSGNVIYLNASGGVRAVGAQDGTELWRSSAPSVATEPFAWEGEVYIGGGGWGDSSLHGLDAQTGQENWLFDIRGGPGILNRPTVSDGVVYFGDSDGWMHAVK